MDRLVGVLSDAHGNERAFRLAVKKLAAEGATEFIFLGDAVGYIPSTGVLAALKELGESVTCLMGNHEAMMLSEHQSSNDHVYQLAKVKQNLSHETLASIGLWPKVISRQFNSFSAAFMHGRPEDPVAGYLHEDSYLDPASWSEEVLFVGNTHRPFLRKVGGKLIVNVGSCGLPRDHGLLGSAAILNAQDGNVRIVRFCIGPETHAAFSEFHPVHVDVHALLKRQPSEFWGEMI